MGLGSLLEKYFSVTLNKALQRADWSRRPLPPDMLAYAADDTRYLPALRDVLERELEDLGRLSWAHEEFARLEAVRWSPPTSITDEAFLALKGAKGLRPRALAILRELYKWRDVTARRLDRAPFRIVGNSALTAIARAAPTNPRTLRAVPQLPEKLARRYQRELLDAVRAGLAVPEQRLPRVPRRPRPPRDAKYDARLERLKELRNREARAHGMDPGLLCPNATLQAIARAAPATPDVLDEIHELRTWQRQLLGDDRILAVVQGNAGSA